MLDLILNNLFYGMHAKRCQVFHQNLLYLEIIIKCKDKKYEFLQGTLEITFCVYVTVNVLHLAEYSI